MSATCSGNSDGIIDRRVAARFLLGTITVYAGMNFFAHRDFVVLNSLPSALLLLGRMAFAAEIALHSLWCVFAPVRVTAKIGIAIAVGPVWVAAYDLGDLTCRLALGDSSASYSFSAWLHERREHLLALPYIAVLAQAPLWAAHLWFRWRIVHAVPGAVPQKVAKLTIRHFFVAMAGVGLTLAATKEWNRTAQLRLSILVIVVTVTTVIPTLAILLRPRRIFVCILLGLLIALIASGLLPLQQVLGMRLGSLSLSSFVRELSLVGTYFLFLSLPLLIARLLGYRLVWGRDAVDWALSTAKIANGTVNREEGKH